MTDVTTLGRDELIARIAELEAANERLGKYQAALESIDAIRNDIVGRQRVNWSSHIYPLVAALGEAGFPGEGYEEARANALTANDAIEQLDGEINRMRTKIAELEAAARRMRPARWLDRARKRIADLEGAGDHATRLEKRIGAAIAKLEGRADEGEG